MTNSKSSKRALFSSVVALLLCFTMLLGTTFAWFTDSAASGSNVITAGNLDIVVEYTLDGETWKNLDGATDLFKKGLWEPGHTEVVALRIKNNGTLALKYAANMNIVSETKGKTAVGADIILSDILTVDSIIMDTGAIGDVMLEVAFSDESTLQYTNTASFKNANVLGSDEMLLPGASKYLIVKVDMAETVGNEANHNGTNVPKINFGINVLATQFTYENDSFGDQYDKDAEYEENAIYVYSAGEAFTAFNGFDQSGKSGTVSLSADYKTADSQSHWSSNREYAIRAEGTDVVFDMNGKKVTHDTSYQDGNNTGYTYLFTTAYNGKLTVSGAGSVYSENENGHTCIFYAQGPSEIIINDGDYHAVSGVPVWAGNGATVTINGGSFTSSESGNDQEMIYSSGGIINIYGGFFHSDWEERPLNVADRNRGTGYIYIYGGTFVNFDPSTGGNDPSNIIVMEGYKVVSETQENGDVWYTVVAE